MPKKVIILGGGVAGMSAAHELIERGFEVEVFERQPVYVGGKARSTDVENTATDGRKPLPGEHGFRFFPGFYKHVTDTMKRIPFKGNKNGVFDNLVPTERITMGREGMNDLVILANFPKSLKDLKVLFKAFKTSNTGLSENDISSFSLKIWQLMTSCGERRLQEYERTSWWQFTNADHQSKAYNEFFVAGLTRTLVAAKAHKVSTRTGGDILLQLIFQMMNPFKQVDRVLNAPTNDAWLYPWRDYLIEKGVKYHHDTVVEKINAGPDSSKLNQVIESVEVKHANGDAETVSGDYYIAAVPVERMAELLNDELIAGDATLSNLKELANDVSWMTGIQFYLTEDVKIARGHAMILDSPWSITAISQPQFWPDIDLKGYGNGEVKGIISVDVSNWDNPGYNGKMAKQCTRQEVMEEVWGQLSLGLRVNDEPLLKSEMVLDCNLDRDIQYKAGEPHPEREKLDVSKLKDYTPDILSNAESNWKISAEVAKEPFLTIDKEPLLVNRVNTWELRPEAYCNIPNLFFASDYVRTHTDLATMEGANEAARRAVNAILERDNSSEKKCRIWNLHEPVLLAPYRYYDAKRFKKGLPWKEEVPLVYRLVHRLLQLFK